KNGIHKPSGVLRGFHGSAVGHPGGASCAAVGALNIPFSSSLACWQEGRTRSRCCYSGDSRNACFLTGPLAELCCAPAAVRSGPAALAEYLGLEGYEHTRHVGLLKSQAQWWSPQTASLHLARQLALAKAAVRAAINQSQVDLGPRAGGFGCNSC
ncbi:unnamed protein product, partial [Prorocentrum cordatum]